MLQQALEAEVRALLAEQVPTDSTAMQAIGYKELVRALRGECSLEEAAEDIRRESRRYAKRQMTWLRRDKHLRWLLWENTPDIALGLRFSTAFLREFGVK